MELLTLYSTTTLLEKKVDPGQIKSSSKEIHFRSIFAFNNKWWFFEEMNLLVQNNKQIVCAIDSSFLLPCDLMAQVKG